jgi:hypothetical protein
MASDSAKPRLTGAAKKPRPETVMVEVEEEPESEVDVVVVGSKRTVTLKENTEGATVKVRILRACNRWIEGDEPTINAEYAGQLMENGLAEVVPAKRSPPKGNAATA